MAHPHEGSGTPTMPIDPWEAAFARADQFAEKLKEIATDHGEAAVDLTIQVVRFEGVAVIGAGFSLGIMALVMAGLFWWGFTWYATSKTAPNTHGSTDKYEFFGVMFQVVGGVGTIGLSIATVVHLVDLWAWIAIIEPKVALAKKLIDSVL